MWFVNTTEIELNSILVIIVQAYILQLAKIKFIDDDQFKEKFKEQ